MGLSEETRVSIAHDKHNKRAFAAHRVFATASLIALGIFGVEALLTNGFENVSEEEMRWMIGIPAAELLMFPIYIGVQRILAAYYYSVEREYAAQDRKRRNLSH